MSAGTGLELAVICSSLGSTCHSISLNKEKIPSVILPISVDLCMTNK